MEGKSVAGKPAALEDYESGGASPGVELRLESEHHS